MRKRLDEIRSGAYNKSRREKHPPKAERSAGGACITCPIGSSQLPATVSNRRTRGWGGKGCGSVVHVNTGDGSALRPTVFFRFLTLPLWTFSICPEQRKSAIISVRVVGLVFEAEVRKSGGFYALPLIFYAPILTIKRFVKIRVTASPAMHSAACRASFRALFIVIFPSIFFVCATNDIRIPEFSRIGFV